LKFGPFAIAAALWASAAAAQPPLEDLPAILHLQLDQRPAWRTYKDALAEDRAGQSHAAAEAARLNALNTPERLDALRAQLKAQEGEFERQASATTSFYAVLSPDQRRIFDAVTRAPVPPPPMHPLARVGAWGSGAVPAGSLRRPPPGAGLPPPGA
jgi:hypothetical protein